MVKLCALILAILAAQPDIQDASPSPELKPLLPGIKLADGVVEFRGEIAVDAHHPETPNVYLEMLVTAPNSREHESLIVSPIKPSSLHAALLAAGLEPGRPLNRDGDGNTIPATGDDVIVLVSLVDDDGEPGEFIPLVDWAIHVDDDSPLVEANNWEGLVFAGSKLTHRGYAADLGGTLVSLTPFGDEVVSPVWTVSHRAEINEPVWIANRHLLPKQGTLVVVRIEAAKDEPEPTESHEPERIDIDRDP